MFAYVPARCQAEAGCTVRLPQELLDRILDYLHDDKHSLGLCALASSALLPTARHHRFRAIDDPSACARLEPILANSPDLASSVKKVVFYCPNLRPAQLSLLPHLTALSTISLKGTIDEALSIVPYARGIRTLCFVVCGWGNHIQDYRVLIEVISKFPSLEVLRLSAEIDDPLGPLSYQTYLPPPCLREVKFLHGRFLDDVYRWIVAESKLPVVFSVDGRLSNPLRASSFMNSSKAMANVIQELTIIFQPYGNMDSTSLSVIDSDVYDC